MLKINQIMIAVSGLAVLLLAPRGVIVSSATLSVWNYALISASLVFVSTSLCVLGGLRHMRQTIEAPQEAPRETNQRQAVAL